MKKLLLISFATFTVRKQMKEIVAWTSSNTAWTNRLRQVLTKSKNENCAFYFLLCFIFLMPKMLGIPIHKRLELAFHSHLGPQGV